MFVGQLDTPESSIRLVRPVVERDASLSFQWLAGEHGRATLLLMGVPAGLIEPPTLVRENARISNFIHRDDQPASRSHTLTPTTDCYGRTSSFVPHADPNPGPATLPGSSHRVAFRGSLPGAQGHRRSQPEIDWPPVGRQ